MFIMRFLIAAAVLCIGETTAQTTISPNPLAGLPSAPGADGRPASGLGEMVVCAMIAPAHTAMIISDFIGTPLFNKKRLAH